MQAYWHPLVFALLAGGCFAPLEWLRPERSEQGPLRPAQRRTDLAFASVGAVATQLLLALVMGAALTAAASVRLVHLELPAWAEILVGLVVFELAGYAYHRCAHAVPALWRLHAVHHSAPRMDWLASFRQHPVEILLLTLAQNLPLVLLGVPLASHALIVVLLALNTVFVHANLRVELGPLRHLIATPRFHHRHHDAHASPRNFASLLPILDRVFGTYSDTRARSFGLAEPHPEGFLGLLLSPLRRPARSDRHRG